MTTFTVGARREFASSRGSRTRIARILKTVFFLAVFAALGSLIAIGVLADRAGTAHGAQETGTTR
ncbi:MAG TPA: hypothetical protein PKY31_04600 [Spirochaetota bacterium]|nr:hypothetical protein [Spirochaetota bacterium]